MLSHENTNWLFDYGLIEDNNPSTDGNFPIASEFSWPVQTSNGSPNLGVEIDSTFGDPDSPKETGPKKRMKPESSGASTSKACREKLRRDRLNDKFLELSSLLEPGKPPKTDKAAILVDAVKMVTQLRGEAQKLKDSNSDLQEKIKELKVEKNELREEKQRLKMEKEKLEGEVKGINKFVPVISYPGVAMWQFMPHAAVDTSQDHVLRPPVA